MANIINEITERAVAYMSAKEFRRCGMGNVLPKTSDGMYFLDVSSSMCHAVFDISSDEPQEALLYCDAGNWRICTRSLSSDRWASSVPFGSPHFNWIKRGVLE